MDKAKLLSIVQEKIDKLEKANKRLDKNVLQSFKSVLLNTKSTQVFQKFLSVSKSSQKQGSSLEEKYKAAIKFYEEISEFFKKHNYKYNYMDLARAFGYAARIMAAKEMNSKTNSRKPEKKKQPSSQKFKIG